MRRVAALSALCLVAAALSIPAGAAEKVLHVAYLIAETNFDPAAVADLYSNNVIEEIFEAYVDIDLARRARDVH